MKRNLDAAGHPRSCIRGIRMRPEEMAHIDALAAQSGMNRQDYVVRALHHASLQVESDPFLFSELRRPLEEVKRALELRTAAGETACGPAAELVGAMLNNVALGKGDVL